MSKDKYQKQWEAINQRMERVNCELLTLTYGSLVTQLLKDLENVDAVNAQLEKMGYNMGVRLVDEFLAKADIGPCADFRQTAEVVAKLGFRMFLGVTGDVKVIDGYEDRIVKIVLTEIPLNDFVELPTAFHDLQYANLICGVIRGSLEQLQMKVICTFEKDMLKGDDYYELRLELLELMKEEFIDDEA